MFFLVGGLGVRSGVEWLVDTSVGTDAVVVECADEQLDELDCLFEVGSFSSAVRFDSGDGNGWLDGGLLVGKWHAFGCECEDVSAQCMFMDGGFVLYVVDTPGCCGRCGASDDTAPTVWTRCVVVVAR